MPVRPECQTCAGQTEGALFVYNSGAACHWYNTRLTAAGNAQRQYCWAGWLAGQALHNRTHLGVRLAPLLWQKVLEGDSFQASAVLCMGTVFEDSGHWKHALLLARIAPQAYCCSLPRPCRHLVRCLVLCISCYAGSGVACFAVLLVP